MAKRSVDLGMRDLVAAGVILRTGAGPHPMYVLNAQSALVRHAVLPLFRGCQSTEHGGGGELGAIDELYSTLRYAVEVPDGESVEWAAIFGSISTGSDSLESDIDLGVIVTDESALHQMRERMADMLPVVRRRFGRVLSPVVLTSDQARALAATGHKLIDAIAGGQMITSRHSTLREVLDR